MADPCGPYGLPLATGELEDELALVLGLGLEDGEGPADVGEAPVDERRAGVVGRDGYGLEEGVEGVQGNCREAGARCGGEHGGHARQNSEDLRCMTASKQVLYSAELIEAGGQPPVARLDRLLSRNGLGGQQSESSEPSRWQTPYAPLPRGLQSYTVMS